MANKELTHSGVKLNVWVFFMVIPIWLLVSGAFVYWIGGVSYWHAITHFLDFRVFLILIPGIIVHEMLHALTWMVLNRAGFRNIKFGFNVHSFTPYTHYCKPMKVWKYALGGAMPGFVMGIIPVVWSYFIKSVPLNFVGFLFLWAAGGDIISLWMLRKLKPEQYVEDHPEKMGFILVGEK
jgi:hypothetical protein